MAQVSVSLGKMTADNVNGSAAVCIDSGAVSVTKPKVGARMAHAQRRMHSVEARQHSGSLSKRTPVLASDERACA